MKATGIVRRIDDLGRVVIPKEIRRTMRIREGDPLEIYTDREGEVIFKKYSPIGELSSFAMQYAESMQRTCALDIVICDRDAVIAYAGVPKKEYADKRVSGGVEEMMENRNLYAYKSGDEKIPAIEEDGRRYVRCAMPIMSDGDIIGCVCSLGQRDEEQSSMMHQELESKLVQTAASFLGKQHEA